MSEEEFKSVRITLSEEAMKRLEMIMRDAAFRSYSSAIEECIRATFDVIEEIYIVAGDKNSPDVVPTTKECIDSLSRIIMRMSRFTGRGLKRVAK